MTEFQDGLVGVKNPFVAKILRFLVQIYIVPVRTNSKGEYELKVLLWRFFLSHVIWSIFPVGLKLKDTTILEELKSINSLFGFHSKASFGLNLAGEITDICFFLTNPISL